MWLVTDQIFDFDYYFAQHMFLFRLYAEAFSHLHIQFLKLFFELFYNIQHFVLEVSYQFL